MASRGLQRREIALGLMRLAVDIATSDRELPSRIRRYTYELETHVATTIVVPEAIHTALCPSQGVLVDDEEGQVFICIACLLAIETGPQ